jgi:Family of unknown function (DUF6090)
MFACAHGPSAGQWLAPATLSHHDLDMANHPLRDSAREVILIVVGVMIAFGVDARWEDSRERREEVRILRSLQTEMVENGLRLKQVVGVRMSARDGAETLFDITGPGAQPQLSSVVDSLLAVTSTGVATYDPLTGSTDALILGGQLASISNDSLRLALASWPEQLRDLREDEVWLIEYSMVDGTPISFDGHLIGSTGLNWAAKPDEYTPLFLLRDPEFARRVETYISSFDQIIRAAEALSLGIATITRLLESELD